ncbi:hypothetical protein NMG60_11008691 [Bertholletia excelsa]
MDDSIRVFCKTLALFCNHLESSCDALKQSVERRPIPFDSASSTFVQCLNRRLSSTSGDLDLLESMSLGTVSFEELLGHCNEVYKRNQSDLPEIEDRLRNFGYIPETEMDGDEGSEDSPSSLGIELKTVDADPLLEDSYSLRDLGLSDVSLATIASEANYEIDSLDTSMFEAANLCMEKPGMKKQVGHAPKFLDDIGGDDQKSVELPCSVINVSKNDYESLPSYMRTLASWEDLLAAVESINSVLCKSRKTKDGTFFRQDELASLGLGPKGRSYLLLLLRMNHLVVETIDGSISYRVL